MDPYTHQETRRKITHNVLNSGSSFNGFDRIAVWNILSHLPIVEYRERKFGQYFSYCQNYGNLLQNEVRVVSVGIESSGARREELSHLLQKYQPFCSP